MSQLPPGFVLDGAAPTGPVYGPPPVPKAPPAPKTTYRTLTPEEAQAQGLPPGGVYQVSSEGNLNIVSSAPKDGDGVGAAMTQNKRSEMKDSLVTLDQFETDLKSLEAQFKQNFDNQGLATPLELRPGWMSTTNQDYNQTSMRLLPLVAKALGFTAKQMDTPAELVRLEAYVPKNTDGDETARHKLEVLRGMLERQRQNLSSQLGGTAKGSFQYNGRTITFDIPEGATDAQIGEAAAKAAREAGGKVPASQFDVNRQAAPASQPASDIDAILRKHGVIQ